MSTETVLGGKRASPPPVEATLAEIAMRQHGVVTIAQLVAAGLSHSAVSKRVARGALHRVGYGVYAVGHAALSREGAWLAGVLAGGEGAVLSHRSAAKLWEISRFSAPITEVTSTHRREARRDAVFHRTRVLDALDVSSHLRIPVTSVHRLLVDLTDSFTPHQVANVIHEAAFRGRFVESATRDAMGRVAGRHRLHVLQRAIALHHEGSAGTKSGAEDAFLALVADFPEPCVNMELAGFERDFHWPGPKLVVEIDGPAHSRPRSRLEDARRDRTLVEAGYTALRFTDAAIRRSPRTLLATLEASYR